MWSQSYCLQGRKSGSIQVACLVPCTKKEEEDKLSEAWLSCCPPAGLWVRCVTVQPQSRKPPCFVQCCGRTQHISHSKSAPIRRYYPNEMFIYSVPGCDGHSSSHPHGHGKGRNFTRGCRQKNLDGGLQGTDCQGKFVSKANHLHFLSTSCKLERGQSRQTP